MTKTRLAILALTLAILAALGLLFTVLLPLVRPKPPKLAATANLLTQVQTLSQLVTIKYVVEKIVKLEGDPSLLPLNQDQVIILARAVVKAGVDLSQLKADDLKVTDKRISIIIPPAKITDCYLDDQKTEIWEHKTALFRRFDKNLEQNARRQALDQIKVAAGDDGIQKEALDRAKAQLTHLFQLLGFTEVEVRTRAESQP